MERDEYSGEIRKIGLDKNFRGSRLPKPVFDFGWEIAKFKPKSWIQERVKFWLYAYDKSHTWTQKDFMFEITDQAWEKAKEKRRERRQKALERPPKRTKVYDLPQGQNSWSECEGSLERTLAKLGVSSLHEAVFGEKEKS